MDSWANQVVMVCLSILSSGHEEMLSMQLDRLYNTEFRDSLVEVEQSLSVENRRAKQIMEESVVLVDGHCQIKLPFRHRQFSLPS